MPFQFHEKLEEVAIHTISLIGTHVVRQRPCLKPQLISAIIEGARLLAHSFNILFGNPSSPMDFPALIDCRRDVTSWRETCIK